jgi:hypothetical protein
MQRFPFYLFFLSVFFVFQISKEYSGIISLGNSAKLVAMLLCAEAVITMILWTFLKNIQKAALFTFALFLIYLFFGVIQDLTNARYRFILPVTAVLLTAMLYYLRKTPPHFRRLVFYLNTLMFFFTVTGSIQLKLSSLHAAKKLANAYSGGYETCSNCEHPDIYLIILDEYSGEKSLETKMGFSNQQFISSLQQRNFRVLHSSSSNYNSTPFSIASLLEMNYLDLDMNRKEAGNLSFAFYSIYHNRLTSFLKTEGYGIVNLSSFSLKQSGPLVSNEFIPGQMKLLMSHTFSGRLANDLRFDLITGRTQNKQLLKKIIYRQKVNNDFILANILQPPSASPVFILAHLMMPHSPFYFDSSGHEIPLEKLTENKENETGYLQYLKYCNRTVLNLTDSILQHSSKPHVIILASDHGYRRHNDPADSMTCFNNLIAVCLPAGGTSVPNENMSNVNLGRWLLNSLFNQQLPLLKDSSVYLWRRN